MQYDVWTKNPKTAAYQTFGNSAIYLFPPFWDLPREPDERFCPQVRNNKVAVNDQTLGLHQWGTLVHELADKYLHPAYEEGMVEYYDVQDCIDLPAGRQVVNAENYSLFASGELRIWGCGEFEADEELAVKARCANLPRP